VLRPIVESRRKGAIVHEFVVWAVLLSILWLFFYLCSHPHVQNENTRDAIESLQRKRDAAREAVRNR